MPYLLTPSLNDFFVAGGVVSKHFTHIRASFNIEVNPLKPCCCFIKFCGILNSLKTFFFSLFYLIFLLILFCLTLQYCIGFAIYQNESATGTHVFPILNPPPSSFPIPSLWVIQCTSPKHPVSCIEPGLATHFIYDIVHISMPFSQIIPLSPSPTESKRLFYISVSLLLSRIQGYCYHLSKSIYMC